jgi:acyl carrier protein phosphodiesterase
VNWLAHALLSDDSVEFRLGNVLADLVKGRERKTMSDEFLRGVKHHQKIDAFTDTHPIVCQSRKRISDSYRRFSGILVDIFYDYYLANAWQEHCDIPLLQFTSALYAQLQAYPMTFSEDVQFAIDRLIEDDRLGLYQHIHGIENTLKRVSNRIADKTGRDFKLDLAIDELTNNHAALASDFARFVPQLKAYVQRSISSV